MPRLLEVCLRFLRLGFIAFGGPLAHLGYFEREFVERAKWLDREAFAEMVALCTVLPGPTSSQVGMLLGATRAGPLGALAAWLGFTTPSAVALACAGWILRIVFQAPSKSSSPVAFEPAIWRVAYRYLETHPPMTGALLGALSGTIITAFAVILFALMSLWGGIVRSIFARVFVCIAFCAAMIELWYTPNFSWTILLAGALAGAICAPQTDAKPAARMLKVPAAYGIAGLAILIAILVSSPFATNEYAKLFTQTFRAGSLVFGGGHVVLSFLRPESDQGRSAFQTGYGIVQAMPGPLFSFAAFFGATDRAVPNAAAGAAVATLGIFAPSAFILPAALSLWNGFAKWKYARRILCGLNVCVVGLLGATFVIIFIEIGLSYRPRLGFVSFIAIAFLLLWRARWPSWAVVLATASACALYVRLPDIPSIFRLY